MYKYIMLILFLMFFAGVDIFYLTKKGFGIKKYLWLHLISVIIFFLEIFLLMKENTVYLKNFTIIGTLLSLYGISLIDCRDGIIDKYLLFAMFSCSIFSLVTFDVMLIINSVIASIALGSIMLIIAKISKGIGGGDVKMVYVMAFSLGFKLAYATIVYSLFFAILYSVVAIIAKKMTMKSEVKYAPFLFIGLLLSIVVGVR